MGQQCIAREKRSPKARKKLDKQIRAMVAFSPAARKLKSENTDIVKNARAWKDSFGMSVFLFILHDLH